VCDLNFFPSFFFSFFGYYYLTGGVNISQHGEDPVEVVCREGLPPRETAPLPLAALAMSGYPCCGARCPEILWPVTSALRPELCSSRHLAHASGHAEHHSHEGRAGQSDGPALPGCGPGAHKRLDLWENWEIKSFIRL